MSASVSRKTLLNFLNGRGEKSSEKALCIELVFKRSSADH
jgi:hypothetical protein